MFFVRTYFLDLPQNLFYMEQMHAIQLTTIQGEETYINLTLITYFQSTPTGTIVSLGSKKLQVVEDLATIEDKLVNEVYEVVFG